MKKEDRISPIERILSDEKVENLKKSEKSGSSTPDRFEKPKKAPKSSGAEKSQDVPKKLKSDEIYNKTPGRNTEIKKTVLSKELDKEKDEFDFSDGDSPTKKGMKGRPQTIGQFPRKSKEKTGEDGLE